MVLLCLDKSSLPTAMMSMRLFVFVSVLVNSCIVLSTTTAKALDSCAISGGIQFSYQDYVTVSAASIMTVAARNDGRQSKAKQSKKKKPAKIATPEEVEEKKQERLRKQRESVEERRRQSKKPAKIDTPEEVAEKKQERLRKQREVEARRRQSKKVELTPEEKREKQLQRLQQRRNANSTSRSSSKHLPVTTENDFRRRSRHHQQQIEAVQEAPSRQNHSNDDPTNQNVPHPRTQPNQSLETYLEEQVLSGGRPTLNLDDFPETQEYQDNFASRMNGFKMFWCKACKERSHTKVECRSTPGECKDCESSRKKHDGIAILTAPNDQDPYPNGIRLPDGLEMPTQIEEMLLGRIFPIMRVFRLGNGEIGYKGSVLNVEQDSSPIWNTLPVRPAQYPFLIIRKPDDKMPSNFREFQVRRDVMLRWLIWLKDNVREYRSIEIDMHALSEIPAHGDITGLVPTLFESSPSTNDPKSQASQDAADDDNDNVPEQEMGPMQGGATGMPIGEEMYEEEYMAQPLKSNSMERTDIIDTLRQVFSLEFANKNPSTPIAEWPAQGAFVNDYSMPSLQIMTFPTLFPYGCGDVTNKDRSVTVSMTDSNKHLLNYAIYDESEGRFIYPFASHPRWLKWAQNTCERHRLNGQKDVYLSKNPEDSNLSEADLRRIIETGGEEFTSMLGRMQAYNGNINGSNAYFFGHKGNLEALMEQEGMCTMWFTLSAADNHWDDLHMLLMDGARHPVFSTQEQKAKYRRKLVREYPHIVDHYFYERVQALLECFFGADSALEAKWTWFRIEYQERGTAHGHGCLRLKCDPGLSKLTHQVYAARLAQVVLESHDALPSGSGFSLQDCSFDTLVEAEETSADAPLADDISTLLEVLKKGVKAHDIIVSFQDFLLSTMHPHPPSDASSDHRDEESKFCQTTNNSHPSSLVLLDILSAAPEVRSTCQGDLDSAVQRHVCQFYCQRKKKQAVVCRFSFPQAITNRTCVAITETTVGKGANKHKKATFELVSARNDCWLNSHCVPLMEVWRANMDFRLTLDFGKVIGYMTKYVTKQESISKKGTQRMIRNILNESIENGKPVLHALKKTMGKLNGERMMSRQETSHLIQGLPLVSCSHSFVVVNMKTLSTKVQKPEEQAESAALKSISELYGERMNIESWPNEMDMQAFQEVHSPLLPMSFHSFAGKCYVCQKGRHRNKLRCHQRKVVTKFTPKLSCDPEGKNYAEYCRYALIKYRPWEGSISNAWGGEENQAAVIKEWHVFLEALASNGIPAPDFLDREIKTYLAIQRKNSNEDDAAGMLINPGADGAGDILEQEGKDDWMHGADDNFVLNDDVLEDTSAIEWSRDHSWDVPEDAYEGNHAPGDIDSTYTSMLKSESTFQRKVILRSQLNEKQRQAHDLVLASVKAPPGSSKTDTELGEFGRCFLLRGQGGTGKSFTIDAICNSVSQCYGEGASSIMATTGKAATVIGGSTVHSTKQGLALPVGRTVFKELKGRCLQQLQTRYAKIRLVVIDEFSMLRQKELHWVDMRLRQAKGNNEPFGGLTVVLSGDTAQLPPVQGNSLWARYTPRTDNELGHSKYVQYFNEDIELVDVKRVEKSDKDAVSFLEFLNRLRDGECSASDWNYVCSHCSQDSMGMDEWKRRGFQDPDLMHLYTTNREVHEHNAKSLKALNKPILLIEAHQTGKACKLPDDRFHNLPSTLHLCVGAKILMTSNVCQPVGLCNGAMGTVKDFIFDSTCAPPPCLPKFIWVDFCDGYTGPSYFPNDLARRGWVPVKPMVVETSTPDAKHENWNTHSRSMFPLRLSYALTIWKAQGQTIRGKFIVCLSTKEKEHGLTYTAFSRATVLTNIGIIGGLTRERLCEKILMHAKMKPRKIEDQRLNLLGSNTTTRYSEHFAPAGERPHGDVIMSQPAPTTTILAILPALSVKKRTRIQMPMPARPRKRPSRSPRIQSLSPIREQQHQNMHSLRSAVNDERDSVNTFMYQLGNGNEIIDNYRGATITRSSVRRLQPGVWLNDELIQYFAKMVTNQDILLSSVDLSRKRSNIFSSIFHTRLMGEGSTDPGYSYEAVKSWTSKTTDDIFELDKILIPINVSNTHWIAAMVLMADRSIQIYDPYPMEGNSYTQLYFDRILRFLGDEHFNKKGVALPATSSWHLVLQDPQLPTQPNGYDCGVYVSAFIYFSVLDLQFRRGLTSGDVFAADLRFRFAKSIMSKIIHF